ncbi:hypothetical protein Hs30E_15070 [Lactococcus hodotermopsidis]|uniref:Uncharacterized protein n=1 Tax=Pseudolactococcus hodotermopsidis TaxID=2709157 RepID=A0A6A0BDS6_9LACT|nr:XcbB/CpsF family capsular polysaccharide biosynthesis protein [Lactococcus hodotermopsidis]GFH42956.1 hypothetical protein Hs30E_15070 [Lactococcus hodotermopsidis]
MEKVLFEKFDNTDQMRTFYQKNPKNHARLKELTEKGYTVDGFVEATQEFRFVPISDISTDMSYFDGVYYVLEMPVHMKDYLPNNLIVMFMAHAAGSSRIKAIERYSGVTNFQSLGKQLPANTYILRIADSNLVAGSFYADTRNFPDYTATVQKLITKIRDAHEIAHERTEMIGTSRGGTGALIHGVLGGYETVAVDPIINVGYVDDGMKGGWQLFDFLPENLAPYINSLVTPTKQKIKILTSEVLSWTYGSFSELALPNLEILGSSLSLPFSNDITRHGAFIEDTVTHFVSLINSYFYSLTTIKMPRELPTHLNENFDIFLPLPTADIAVKETENKLQIYQESTAFSRLVLKLKQPLRVGVTYEMVIESDAPELQFYLQYFSPFFQKPRVSHSETKEGLTTQRYYFEAQRDFIYAGVSSFSIPRNKLVTIKSFKIREI